MSDIISGAWNKNTGVKPLVINNASIDIKFSDGDSIGDTNALWLWGLDEVCKITHWRYHNINDLPKAASIVQEKKMTPSVGIGDVNSDAKGSGARYNSGKPDMSLIPLCTLEDEARVWSYGKAKYAAWNFAKGMDWSVPFACMLRHMGKWQAGEELDEESGLPHLDHAMCNLRMLKLYSKTYKEGDDRPPKHLLEGMYNESK